MKGKDNDTAPWTEEPEERPRKSRRARRAPPETAADVAARLQALGPEAVEFARRLAIVNSFEMWADCPREECRRARLCRGADADCFDERRGELKQRMLKLIVMWLVAANISQDEFYDYLEMAGEEADPVPV